MNKFFLNFSIFILLGVTDKSFNLRLKTALNTINSEMIVKRDEVIKTLEQLKIHEKEHNNEVTKFDHFYQDVQQKVNFAEKRVLELDK